MPPAILFDISKIDLNHVAFNAEEIEKTNPHRGHMRLIDGMIHVSEDNMQAVAYKDCRHDEFWVAGHIPGRPIYPGVLMIESAAQLSSFVTLRAWEKGNFMGFIAADGWKFRNVVLPGQRLILLGKMVELRPGRRSIVEVQGLVDGQQVFEGRITGMPL
jgi:3-hydroxyacyl-[acyl-carrier-protein] dehydratase